MEPPVSVPSDQGTCPAATAAAEPPEDPRHPGGIVGFLVTPKAEYSVEEPMANSSKLVFPIMINPARFTRSTTVASYTGR